MKLYTENQNYEDFNRIIREQAGFLALLPPGTRITVSDTNKVRLAATLLACYERRIVAIPLDLTSSYERRSLITIHSKAAYECVDGTLSKIRAASPSPPELRFIIYTSGTTGIPKGVMLSELNVRSNALAVAEAHNFKTSPHCTPLPLYHVNALCMSLLGCYLSNSTLVLIEHFKPEVAFALCDTYQCETISLVPTLISRVLEVTPPWPQSLKYVISAAAPLSRRLSQKFFERYGPKLRQGYGLSEATNFSFIMPLLDEASFRHQMIDLHPPVGHPLPGTEFKLVNEEVLVRGPNVFMGYLENNEETNRVLVNGWLHTGDIGELRDGFMILKGRIKEIILRGGETLYPSDVEQLYASIGIRDGVVVAVPEEDLGEDAGLALEVGDPNAICLSLSQLPLRHQPCAVLCSTIPRTSTGKVQRRQLASKMLTGYSALDGCMDTSSIRHRIESLVVTFRRLLQCENCLIFDLIDQPLERLEMQLGKGMISGHILICMHSITSPTRREIFTTLASRLQFSQWGWSRLRSGKRDLGGFVWIHPTDVTVCG